MFTSVVTVYTAIVAHDTLRNTLLLVLGDSGERDSRTAHIARLFGVVRFLVIISLLSDNLLHAGLKIIVLRFFRRLERWRHWEGELLKCFGFLEHRMLMLVILSVAVQSQIGNFLWLELWGLKQHGFHIHFLLKHTRPLLCSEICLHFKVLLIGDFGFGEFELGSQGWWNLIVIDYFSCVRLEGRFALLLRTHLDILADNLGFPLTRRVRRVFRKRNALLSHLNLLSLLSRFVLCQEFGQLYVRIWNRYILSRVTLARKDLSSTFPFKLVVHNLHLLLLVI